MGFFFFYTLYVYIVLSLQTCSCVLTFIFLNTGAGLDWNKAKQSEDFLCGLKFLPESALNHDTIPVCLTERYWPCWLQHCENRKKWIQVHPDDNKGKAL